MISFGKRAVQAFNFLIDRQIDSLQLCMLKDGKRQIYVIFWFQLHAPCVPNDVVASFYQVIGSSSTFYIFIAMFLFFFLFFHVSIEGKPHTITNYFCLFESSRMQTIAICFFKLLSFFIGCHRRRDMLRCRRCYFCCSLQLLLLLLLRLPLWCLLSKHQSAPFSISFFSLPPAIALDVFSHKCKLHQQFLLDAFGMHVRIGYTSRYHHVVISSFNMYSKSNPFHAAVDVATAAVDNRDHKLRHTTRTMPSHKLDDQIK